MFLLLLLTLILITLTAIFIFATLRTWHTQTSPNQQKFLSGSIPKDLPNGLFKGRVTGLKTSWQGKKFSSNEKGVNVFKDKEKYPFKFYIAKGLQDNKQVIRIDYNLPENPLWLRFIVDEIVQTSPNKYLGKLHIKLIPGLVASLGYFTLEK